ncbi:MAG: OmpA family protein [Akkermansiaceae bacterium]
MTISKLHIALVTIAATVLSSCTTVNPYTNETQVSKTATGATIGALGGAALGALIGNNRSGGSSREGAITGALIGAGAGAGIGLYMDTQEADVRRQLQGSGVSVTRSGNELILNMPSDITFNSGSSALKSQFGSTLNSVALVLKKYKKTSISIIGHTDSDGAASYNQNLSVARAQAVASDLNSRGVIAARLLPQGVGEKYPVANNGTSAGKAQNRRVELRIVPVNSQF